MLSPKDFTNICVCDYEFDATESTIYSVGMAIGDATTLWGNGIDEVKVAIKNLPLRTIQVMGQKKNCLKISYKGVDYVRFGDTDMIDALMENRLQKIDIIGSFSINEWNGRRSLQIFIDDWQFSDEEEEKAHKFDF